MNTRHALRQFSLRSEKRRRRHNLLKYEETWEIHLEEAKIHGNTSSWGDFLFSLRDGVYMMLGRDRLAIVDSELVFLALIGPVGAGRGNG